MGGIIFKIADQPHEFEQIFRLNYKTFTEEIPQNVPNPEKRRVDKFHTETHILSAWKMTVCWECSRCATSVPSRWMKIREPRFLPASVYIHCEIRLLTVEPDKRSTRIFGGLAAYLAKYCDEHKYDLALISGTTRQAKLYRHLGFTPSVIWWGRAMFCSSRCI